MRAAHDSVGSSCRLGVGDHSAEAKLQDSVKEELHGALLQRIIAYDLVSGRVPLLRASNLVSGRNVLCTEVLRHATELVSKHGPCNMHARIRGRKRGGFCTSVVRCIRLCVPYESVYAYHVTYASLVDVCMRLDGCVRRVLY